MHSIRDIVKASIDYACNELTEDEYVSNKIYKKFIKNPLVKRLLDRQIQVVKRLPKLGPSSPELLANLKPDELKIAIIVAEEHNVNVDDIFTRTRKREIVDARMQLNAIYYIYFRYTYCYISRMVDRDHSSVIHNVRENENCMDTNVRYKIRFHNIINKGKTMIPNVFNETYENLEQNVVLHKQKVIERVNLKQERDARFQNQTN